MPTVQLALAHIAAARTISPDDRQLSGIGVVAPLPVLKAAFVAMCKTLVALLAAVPALRSDVRSVWEGDPALPIASARAAGLGLAAERAVHAVAAAAFGAAAVSRRPLTLEVGKP